MLLNDYEINLKPNILLAVAIDVYRVDCLGSVSTKIRTFMSASFSVCLSVTVDYFSNY